MKKEKTKPTVQAAFLDDRDAAALTGFGVQTLRNWRFKHIGPPYTKLNGKAVRYSIQELLNWMEANRVDPGREI